jgi:hypothetical protein
MNVRRHLIAVAAAALILPVAAMAQTGASGQGSKAGSQSLTDPRTTGADKSGGTPSASGTGMTPQVTGTTLSGRTQGSANPGRALQGLGAGSQTLTDPRTSGAEGSGGTPSNSAGAGGG